MRIALKASLAIYARLLCMALSANGQNAKKALNLRFTVHGMSDLFVGCKCNCIVNSCSARTATIEHTSYACYITATALHKCVVQLIIESNTMPWKTLFEQLLLSGAVCQLLPMYY